MDLCVFFNMEKIYLAVPEKMYIAVPGGYIWTAIKVHLKKVADSLPLFCISKRIATGNFPAWQVEIDAMTRAEYKCQFGKMASVAATVKIEFKLKVIKLLAKMASKAATVKF